MKLTVNDGQNTKSCQTPAERAVGKAIITVEGASGWMNGNLCRCGTYPRIPRRCPRIGPTYIRIRPPG